MSEELRPCPFCGNKLPVHYIAMQNRYVQLISCPSCYATISCNKFLSDRDALATWNTRPIEDALNARIAELKELLDTESQLSNQFYLLLVDNPKSKKLADDLIEALRINGKEVQE